MKVSARSMDLSMALGATSVPASAQTRKAQSQPADTRPATTTPSGDTGIWFVPTAETLAPRKWSFSLYRVNFDFQPGFTDVSNWPITFGAGIGERFELF